MWVGYFIGFIKYLLVGARMDIIGIFTIINTFESDT